MAWHILIDMEDLSSDHDVVLAQNASPTIIRTASCLMGKMTPATFDRWAVQFLLLLKKGAVNDQAIKGIVEMIVSLGGKEDCYGAMYSSLCFKIVSEWDTTEPEEVIFHNRKDSNIVCGGQEYARIGIEKSSDRSMRRTMGEVFRDYLLAECLKQAACHDIQADAAEERDLTRQIRKNAHFIFMGELYMKNLLPASILCHCIDVLLDSSRPEDLKCLFKLFKIIGRKIEHHFLLKNAESMHDVTSPDDVIPAYFNRIHALSTSHPDSTVRFMMSDLIELRSIEGWSL